MTGHPLRLFDSAAAIRRVGEGMIACTLPRADWTHEAHLAATVWLILERPDILPERELPQLIRRFNESVGGVNDETQGYHETITQVSIMGVRHFLASCSELPSLLDCVNALLCAGEGHRDWPMRYYSRGRLFSTEARADFIRPDLRPLPQLGRDGAALDGASISPPTRSPAEHNPMGDYEMADLSRVREHMEIIGADGVHVGTVDSVEGDRIKMTKPDSGSHKGHHHYISGGLVATVEGDKVRLTANATSAVLLEEEKGGEGIMDSGSGTWKKVAIGAAVVGAAAAAGAVIYNRRKGSATDETGGETEVDIVFEPDTKAGAGKQTTAANS